MTQTKLLPEEISAKAKELYERELRAQLETPENRGKILAIDVESKDYELDADHTTAYQGLRARHPEGVFFFLRIGYPSLAKAGGGWGLPKI